MRPAEVAKTAVKLLIWSLLVGLLLSFLGLTPLELLGELDEVAARLIVRLQALLSWAVPYILLGAAVVIPIWLLVTLWRRLKR